MRMPTVSKFCFCCDLSLGIKICAWFYVFIYLLVASLALFSFVFEVNLIDFQSIDEKTIVKNETLAYEVAEVGSSRIEFFDAAGTIIICIILAIVAFLFIDGVNLHDPSKMSPFIIQTLIFGFLFVGASIFFTTVYFLIKAIVWFYIFICAYSLQQVFIFEKAQREENDAEMKKYTEQVYESVEEGGKQYGDNYDESGEFHGR